MSRRRVLPALVLLGIAAPAFAQGGYLDPHAGHGTYYDYTGGGNCSFPPPPQGLFTAAMNTADYDTATACGAYVEVTNAASGASVVVRIDDRCPGCAPGDIDLTRAAFAQIASLQAGVIDIRWRYVSGPSTPATLWFEPGSSQWWAALQVRNHRNPVAKLAWRASGSGAAFRKLPREMWNDFTAANGMGPGPYDFKITDVFGNVLRASQVALAPGMEVSLHKQFPLELPEGD
jgi:expansin (peptidoglycan-binding protein)